MNSTEYLAALRQALAVLPDDEIDSAMRYYEDYFLDAGEENAERVIAELGDPQAVAQAILNDYTGLARAPQPEAGQQQTQTDTGRRKYRWGVHPAVLILLVVLASPLLLALGAAVLGILVGIIGAIVGVAVGLAAIPFSLLVAGAGCCFFALLTVWSNPATGVLTGGVGLVLLAIGFLLALLFIKLCILFFPPLMRGLIWLVRWPFDKLNANKRGDSK